MTYIATTDYFTDVAQGLVPGASIQFILGNSPGAAAADTEETIWDQGGTYTYLSAETTLYGSSSSASDTDQILVVVGLDEDYLEVVRIVALNGQNQVALDDGLLRVHIIQQISGTGAVGDFYIAESDSLTGGIPDTASKIKGKVTAGKGISRQFTFTVPAGKAFYVHEQVLIAGKNSDVEISLKLKFFGTTFFVTSTDAEFYQFLTNLALKTPFTIPEKSDFEASFTSTNVGTSVTSNYAGVLITN